MRWFKNKAWRGEQKLWIVFWIYGLVPWTILCFISVALGAKVRPPVITGNSDGYMDQAFYHALYSALQIFLLTYRPWIYASLWKCAFNAKMAVFGYAARLLVILLIAGTVAGLLVPIKGYSLFLNGVYHDPMFEEPPHVVQCKVKMQDVALRNNVNPRDYINANQAYLQKCVQYLDANAKNGR